MINRLLTDPVHNRDEEFVDVETHSRRYSSRRFRWWYIPLAVLLLFPYLSIFALFAMYSDAKHGSTTNNYSTTISSRVTSNFGGQAMPTTTLGAAVSFSANGALQVGAGTTLYLDIANPSVTAQCPSYLSMTEVKSNYFLYSYANANNQQSMLQLSQVSLQGDSSYDVATVVSTLSVNYYIYDITSLSANDGTFVAICQDTNDTIETAFLVGGKVDFSTSPPSIKLSATPYQYTSIYSVSPEIIRLSDNSFAFAYYSSDPVSAVNTAFGILNSDLTVAVSNAVPFADNNDKSYYFSLAPLTVSTYLLTYYNSYENNQTISGPLRARIATVTGGANPVTATITLTNSISQNSTALNYYFASASLDSDTVVVVYGDGNNNNAIVVQAIQIISSPIVNEPDAPSLAFGASWTVNSGDVFAALATGYMDVDIIKVSDDQQFAVLYSDVSNNGALTTSMGQVTQGGAVVRTSPDFLLSLSNPNFGTYHAWGAFASGSTAPLDSQTAILTMIASGTDCASDAITQFSWLERKSSPVGMTSAITVSGVASSIPETITVSGEVTSTTSSYTPGKVYYSNTKGDLVPDSAYAGRSMSDEYYTIVDAAHKSYLTLDSKVGLATAPDKLFVQIEV